MKLDEKEFQKRLKDSLGRMPRMSGPAEARLFERAEEILGARRETVDRRAAESRRQMQAYAKPLLAFGRGWTRVLEILATHSDAPALTTAIAVLILAIVSLRQSHDVYPNHSPSVPPELPKDNNAPALYDAQRLKEQQRYEREVLDAQQIASGGK